MNKKLYTALLTVIISVNSSKAQTISIDPMGDDYYTQTSFATSLVEHRELLVELDSIRKHVDEKIDVSILDANILRRMKSVTKTIPLDYNSQVKYFIDKYISSNYKPYMSRLRGLSNHYFKVYNKVFQELGIPEEVKYLSLVESSLNPHLVSTSGAVGPWQFMYATARGYDLDMNSHIDERKDIYASTYAVSSYLKAAYDQFDDWLLALASYNCGRGCVQRAIARSGMTNPTFWELSPFLPKETQNYIPKFVAMTYVLSNADYYEIPYAPTELDYETKVVMVDKVVDLRHIAQAVNLEVENIKHFNPAYKKTIVNGSVDKPKRIFIPITSQLNDSLLYVALNAPSSINLGVNEEPEAMMAANSSQKYKVRKGESLSSLSKKFGVTVQDLKAWNGLSNKSALVGRTIVVTKPISSTLAKNVAKSTTKTNVSRTAYYVVQKGDSLDRIARKFQGSSVSKIKEDNGLRNTVIRPGMKLKIRKG
ncbi:MAG: LysM peptidoglycan-binding domain-containing protein [Sphingobacterium composti]